MFKSLKKAFGFSNHDDDELINDDPDIVTEETVSNVAGASLPPSPVDIDLLTEGIFQHVVQTFNQSLPDFIKTGIDGERQQKYLYDTLSADLKAHLSSLEKHVMSCLEESWHSERERMQSELKQLEQTAKDIESKRADIKEKQLSSERQRRALSDRVRDLEKQIMTLEAEKEQYELETKSLVNKVKVAQIYEKDIEALREQVNYLQQQLSEKSTNVQSGDAVVPTVTNVIPQETLDELDRLKNVEHEHNALMSSLGELEKHMDEVQKELSFKDTEITRLKEAVNKASERGNEPNEETQRLSNRLTSVQAELEMALKAVTSAEQRAQKAESALKESEKALEEALVNANRQTSQTKSRPLPIDDDILSGTDWTITNPVKRQRKPVQPKKDKNDDGELSLW